MKVAILKALTAMLAISFSWAQLAQASSVGQSAIRIAGDSHGKDHKKHECKKGEKCDHEDHEGDDEHHDEEHH